MAEDRQRGIDVRIAISVPSQEIDQRPFGGGRVGDLHRIRTVRQDFADKDAVMFLRATQAARNGKLFLATRGIDDFNPQAAAILPVVGGNGPERFLQIAQSRFDQVLRRRKVRAREPERRRGEKQRDNEHQE
jgi:hypothetical protein